MIGNGFFNRFFTHRGRIATVLLAWTAAIGGLAWWHYADTMAELSVTARLYAKASHEKDIKYRRWNAAHGGVYVPVSKDTPPNPHLETPERDVITTTGRRLTLVNPAYMTRQVHELPE